MIMRTFEKYHPKLEDVQADTRLASTLALHSTQGSFPLQSKLSLYGLWQVQTDHDLNITASGNLPFEIHVIKCDIVNGL